MFTILQKGKKILEQKAKEIEPDNIQSIKIKDLIHGMKETLRGQKDGIALAAPQIGKSLRLFIILPKAYQTGEKTPEKKQKKNLVFINPKIIKYSKKKKWLEEGCLSVINVFGKVERSTKCTIKAYDENGKLFTRGSAGLLSQIFQHEVDHLDGILFTEKAKDIQVINK